MFTVILIVLFYQCSDSLMVSLVDDSVNNFPKKENPGRSVITRGISLIGIATIEWNSVAISNSRGLILL